MLYNIYCDESCHLENDGINDMVIGAVWCPQEKLREINQRIKDIKISNGVSSNLEMKWTKLSPSKVNLYMDLVNYFFVEDDLHFRAIIVPDKSKLNHSKYNQTHDQWYYKMYYDMLKGIFSLTESYEIYIDIKDTHSYYKSQKLKEVCSNSLHDFSNHVIRRLQPIRSDEIQIMQLVDVLIGAICYENRDFKDGELRSIAKQKVIELIRERSGCSLKRSTSLNEDKVNLFVWDAR